MPDVMPPRPIPRDVHGPSPHSHADMPAWKDDEPIEMDSTSQLVIPPKGVDTSSNSMKGGRAERSPLSRPARLKAATANDLPRPSRCRHSV